MVPSLIRADSLNSRWLDDIQQRDMSDIQSVPNIKLKMLETITVHFCIGEARTQVYFGVVSGLFDSIPLGTTSSDRFIKSIHPSQQKIVSQHSQLVPLLQEYEAGSEAERKNSGTHRFFKRLDTAEDTINV